MVAQKDITGIKDEAKAAEKEPDSSSSSENSLFLKTHEDASKQTTAEKNAPGLAGMGGLEKLVDQIKASPNELSKFVADFVAKVRADDGRPEEHSNGKSGSNLKNAEQIQQVPEAKTQAVDKNVNKILDSFSLNFGNFNDGVKSTYAAAEMVSGGKTVERVGNSDSNANAEKSEKHLPKITDAQIEGKADAVRDANDEKQLSRILNDAQKSSYGSAAAALITLAQKFGKDKDLITKASNQDGVITRESVDSILQADAGALPKLRRLTDEQAETLDSTGTHIRALMEASGLIGRTVGGGLTASVIDALSRENLKEAMKETGANAGKGIGKPDSGKSDEAVFQHLVEKSIEVQNRRDSGLYSYPNNHPERDRQERSPGYPERDGQNRSSRNYERDRQDRSSVYPDRSTGALEGYHQDPRSGLPERYRQDQSSAYPERDRQGPGSGYPDRERNPGYPERYPQIRRSDIPTGPNRIEGLIPGKESASGGVAESGAKASDAGQKPGEDKSKTPEPRNPAELAQSPEKTKALEQLPKTAEKPETPRIDVPQLTQGELTDVAKALITKLDTEKKGFVTKEQLARAMEDPSIQGKEAQALAAMYKKFDGLQELAPQKSWWDSQGISAADLDKYKEVESSEATRRSDAYQMKSWAHKNESKYFSDGAITSGEIDKALSNPATPKEDRDMLTKLKESYSKMGHWYESGVNLKAIDEYAKNVYKDTDHAKLTSGVWSAVYGVNQGQKPNISHDLYGDQKNPLNSINPDAIKQGTIGDCYFVASLAAVAKSNPQLIKDSIKDNGDGTYTVTFPGAKDEPITVKAPTQAEQGLYNGGTENGLWASVMEKAYGAYCQKHFYRRGPFNLGGGDTPTEGADGGGRTAGSMTLLTGKSVDTDMISLTRQSTIATKMEEAIKNNRAITAGINKGILDDMSADKFYTGHAYSITGFVPDGKGGGQVTIRNPWGGSKNTPDGTITVSLEKFLKNFSDVSFEEK